MTGYVIFISSTNFISIVTLMGRERSHLLHGNYRHEEDIGNK